MLSWNPHLSHPNPNHPEYAEPQQQHPHITEQPRNNLIHKARNLSLSLSLSPSRLPTISLNPHRMKASPARARVPREEGEKKSVGETKDKSYVCMCMHAPRRTMETGNSSRDRRWRPLERGSISRVWVCVWVYRGETDGFTNEMGADTAAVIFTPFVLRAR